MCLITVKFGGLEWNLPSQLNGALVLQKCSCSPAHAMAVQNLKMSVQHLEMSVQTDDVRTLCPYTSKSLFQALHGEH